MDNNTRAVLEELGGGLLAVFFALIFLTNIFEDIGTALLNLTQRRDEEDGPDSEDRN